MKGTFYDFSARSSNIDQAVYDGAGQRLLVNFKSGANYLYAGVDAETWEGLTKAESPGKYLKTHVQDRCAYNAVDRDGNPL